jgi:hypothetical protein
MSDRSRPHPSGAGSLLLDWTVRMRNELSAFRRKSLRPLSTELSSANNARQANQLALGGSTVCPRK